MVAVGIKNADLISHTERLGKHFSWLSSIILIITLLEDQKNPYLDLLRSILKNCQLQLQ